MTVTFEDIKRAQEELQGIIVRTPLVPSAVFSEKTGADVFLKLEIFQATGSFKDRGAYTKMKTLTHEELKRGVISMSAGNHAQSVAYHAKALGTQATIVMPVNTPVTKIMNTEKWGARVILEGTLLSESYDAAQKIAHENGYTFIHPYDDPDIIRGQGTIGLEIFEDCPEIDAVIIPIGGGGLSSGISLALKTLNPKIKVYGVEAEGYASLYSALHEDEAHLNYGKNLTLAEGIAVKTIGKNCFEILKDTLDDIFVIDEFHIEEAVDLMVRKQHIVAEGAGAIALAALLTHPKRFEGKKVVLLICGANIDPRVLGTIILRGQIRDGKLARLRIKTPDMPGVLATITNILATHRCNILETHHQRLFYTVPIKMADVDITIETRNERHVEEVMTDIKAAGFEVHRLHDNREG
ncbi:L-threonine ammonia-lyase [Candidatus Bealeia paramacronuclearis]|uniref:L-serine dehydratase n=1 Tax=Candidatus Bealeia paramacronuclearis TaxID=1921001 RepID=A0ABZ2C3N0_9PROT|nr:L-threonine ammonia-lyase [Candidatus Bealeia paramacronuclearis]